MGSRENFAAPDYLPWLNEDYVRKNAWYPVPDMVFDDKPMFINHHEWGIIPCKSRIEYMAGDVIIFDEFDIIEKDGTKYTDRFYILEQRHIDDLFSGAPLNRIETTKQEIINFLSTKTDLLPIGVVVHLPFS